VYTTQLKACILFCPLVDPLNIVLLNRAMCDPSCKVAEIMICKVCEGCVCISAQYHGSMVLGGVGR
jgi:hypothetical protein